MSTRTVDAAATSSTTAESPPRLSCVVFERSADVALGLARTREELEARGGVDGLEASDFELRGYDSAGPIKFKLHP
ncbi:hypothetical protein JCM3775_002222 [Rhodotorula graminis]